MVTGVPTPDRPGELAWVTADPEFAREVYHQWRNDLWRYESGRWHQVARTPWKKRWLADQQRQCRDLWRAIRDARAGGGGAMNANGRDRVRRSFAHLDDLDHVEFTAGTIRRWLDALDTTANGACPLCGGSGFEANEGVAR